MKLKKIFLSIAITLLTFLSAFAENEASFYVANPLKLKPGETTTLAISMKNEVAILGWQMHVYLPEGMNPHKELNDDEELDYVASLSDSRKKSKHVLALDETASGATQLLAEPSDGTSSFKLNDGEIVYFDVEASEDMTPGNYNIILKNIVFSDGENSYDQTDLTIPVTVYAEYAISASSASTTMGTVNLTGGGDKVEWGANVTATATPATGYEFVNWTSGQTVVSTDATYHFTASKDLTLVANFQAKQVTLTFNTAGGSTIAPITAAYGSTVTAPQAPTKTGYTFAGWDVTIPTTMPAENATITAQWTINQYTITFDVAGGSAVNAITQDYNTAVTAPQAPTKTGYTFTGWDKTVPANMPAENITITAQWQINQHKVTFVYDADSISKQTTQDYASAITAPANPTKVGYTFNGWSPVVAATVPDNDVTYTAQWTVNQYTITFDVAGGSAVNAITQDYNTAVTAPQAPTKTGYTFTGWDKTVPANMPAENITITAQWTINQHKVTFVYDADSISKQTTQDYASAITAPANPTKVGYTFNGWSPVVAATVPDNDVTYTAQWTVNQYTITFDVAGGSAVNAITQDYNTAVTAPQAPTKTGYTFTGWDKTVPANMPAENITITAQWTINQHKVTFVYDADSIYKQTTQDYASAITAPANPTKVGYTFNGWSPVVAATVPDNDVTYTAQWQINQYTITFDVVGGSAIDPITQDYNTAVTAPQNPTKTGYTFKSWNKTIPATMPAKNDTLTAQWTINQYTVVFKKESGDTLIATKQNYDSTIEAPADPEKEGYAFVGWYEKNGAELGDEFTGKVPAKNATYYAIFENRPFTVTFIVDGTTVREDAAADYNSDIAAITDPVKEGYTFKGWRDETKDKAFTGKVPAFDAVYTAQWQINQYTVKFVYENDSISKQTTQDYASTITAPADPTKIGYTFTGWSPVVAETVPDSNVVYTAQWQINQYSIVFNTDGGSEVATITQDYATNVTAPQNPTKTGYTFNGWNKQIPATIPAANDTITAQWKINKYRVVFRVDNDTISNKRVDYNSVIEIPEYKNVGDENIIDGKTYVFKGWFEQDGTPLAQNVPAYNVVYYAKWAPKAPSTEVGVKEELIEDIPLPDPEVAENTVINVTDFIDNDLDATVVEENINVPVTKEEQDKGLWVWLEVADKTAEVAANETLQQAVEAITEAIADANGEIGAVIDITVKKQIPGETPVAVEELSTPVTVSVNVPAQLLQAGRYFWLNSVHNGKVNKIAPRSFDALTGKMTFLAGQFSTYTICYAEGEPYIATVDAEGVTISFDSEKIIYAHDFLMEMGANLEESVSGAWTKTTVIPAEKEGEEPTEQVDTVAVISSNIVAMNEFTFDFASAKLPKGEYDLYLPAGFFMYLSEDYDFEGTQGINTPAQLARIRRAVKNTTPVALPAIRLSVVVGDNGIVSDIAIITEDIDPDTIVTDLSGRRIRFAEANGIVILNGKKILVK